MEAVVALDQWQEVLERNPRNRALILAMDRHEFLEVIGRGDEVPHGAHPVAVHLQRYAEDPFGHDLERAARAGQLLEWTAVGHEVAASSCCTTSNDQSSACVLTGPSVLWPR